MCAFYEVHYCSHIKLYMLDSDVMTRGPHPWAAFRRRKAGKVVYEYISYTLIFF